MYDTTIAAFQNGVVPFGAEAMVKAFGFHVFLFSRGRG